MYHEIRRRSVPITIGLLIVLATVYVYFSDNRVISSFRDRLESMVYDIRLNYARRQVPEPHRDIIIIDIDEESLAEIGRWPWPRTTTAQLVNQLFQYGVAVVAFDIMFPEPETNITDRIIQELDAKNTTPGKQTLNVLSSIRGPLDGDANLARALSNGDTVLGYFFSNNANISKGVIGKPANFDKPEVLKSLPVREQQGVTANIPVLQQNAFSSGFVNSFPEPDGVNRQYNLIIRYQDKFYPSLALEAVTTFLAVGDDYKLRAISKYNEKSDTRHLEGISILRNKDIPTSNNASVFIPYRGPRGSFQYVSAADVIHKRIHPDVLDGKAIAFIGTTAIGLFDLRSTPVGNVYPGVEIHANVAAALLDQHYNFNVKFDDEIQLFPTQSQWLNILSFVLMLTVGIIFAIYAPLVSPVLLIFSSFFLYLLFIGLNTWLWYDSNFIIAIATPLFMITAIMLNALAYGFLFEARSRTRLKDMFGQYVPPELVNEMSQTMDSLGFEGDRRDMTVLFSDIRGFTTLSESLSPKELKDLLNRFFTPMTEIIFRNSGTIDKYVGDMIMAFWGAPLQNVYHARDAMQAALAMMKKVKTLQDEFIRLGLPVINVGIGLNSGEMNVGNMGSEFRKAYTVLGDEVNLASRLEGLTKVYGIDIIVGDNTRKADLQDHFLFRYIDLVRVKGRTQPEKIHQLVGLTEEASDDLMREIEQHHDALDHYFNKHWDKAMELFSKLAKENPDCRLYQVYIERMNNMDVDALPANWDGVYAYFTK